MPYRLKGTLKAPNGQPLTGVDLQFIAQQTLSPVLQQTDHNIRLGADGSYDVTLEFNTYAVKAQIGGLGPQHMGDIRVDADTLAGLDLPQLLRSYSQEATAPDYAKMIEGWLKEAKTAADTATAQATSAKAQADRAKTEADRASQITGLDTVADAIGLAAVPFPDVWIPFNDSLRMIAGFGRDVKVDADVVATYVNYERATTATYTDKSGAHRTAAINEPRLEKQGLLIEGQSTNLFLNSEIGANQSIATQADKYTISFYGSGTVSLTGSVAGSLAGSGENNRVSKTFDCSAGNLTIEIMGQVTKAQIEKLPFASSYIPTNGAAVTRAADKCWIALQSNFPLPANGTTISVVASINNHLNARLLEINDGNTIILAGTLMLPRFLQTEPVTGIQYPLGRNRFAFRIGDDARITTYIGNAAYNPPTKNAGVASVTDKISIGNTQGFSGDRGLFGHIRDLKIWHSALSDAQIKGIK